MTAPVALAARRSAGDRPGEALTHALAHAARLLPAQGPMGVFVHHNTLHAYEDRPFDEAVVAAARDLGARPYLAESEFRALHAAGRILPQDIRAAVAGLPADALGPAWPVGGGRDVPAAEALANWVVAAPALEEEVGLVWMLRHGDAFSRFPDWVGGDARARHIEATRTALAGMRGEALIEALATGGGDRAGSRRERFFRQFGVVLRGEDSALELPEVARALWHLWHGCRGVVAQSGDGRRSDLGGARSAIHVRPRGLLPEVRRARVAAGRPDPFVRVTGTLSRLAAAFLDEGVSHWPMPLRTEGFWRAALHALADGASPAIGGLAPARLRELAGTAPAEAVLAVLGRWAIAPHDFGEVVHQLLQLLPGWGGMFWRLETMPHERRDSTYPITLLDWFAVVAVVCDASIGGVDGTWAPAATALDDEDDVLTRTVETDAARADVVAFRLFRAALALGITRAELEALPEARREALLGRLVAFSDIPRRRLWHAAFEARHAAEVLTPLALFARRHAVPDGLPGRPRLAVVCCIDDREESFRRILEERGPDIRTHGHAGFFGFPMRYKGLDDEAAYALCPVNIEPNVLVEERPVDAREANLRASGRRRAAHLLHEVHEASRAPGRGALVSLALAPLQALLLTARILAPRKARAAERWFARRLVPQPATELTLDRRDESVPPAPTGTALALGYPLDEQVTRAATFLENLGMVKNFPRLVIILGHGSSSFNNPHRSAYDCGACGGRHGSANARLAAQVLNRPEVRARLRARGLELPDDTWFIGGFHHTGDDGILLHDLGRVPPHLADDLRRAREDLEAARRDNAFERCRRFEAAHAVASPEAALRHVEDRCQHLSEPRPELGHATNAVAIVGRRSLTRGLFLDRRSFLICYDATIDPQTAILERLLAAVGPVGAGINLEYWFSRVDNERYGAGTKLPHNVTGLFGVMSGAEGDLRTGLPWQMVEIHDPVRLLLIIEATPEAVLTVASRQPVVAQLVVNRWVRVATVDPETRVMHVFEGGQFVPWSPAIDAALGEVPDSRSHWRHHLHNLPSVAVRRITDQTARPAHGKPGSAS